MLRLTYSLPLFGLLPFSPPGAARAPRQSGLVPLAYVRTLALAPAVLLTPPDAPLQPAPIGATKKELAVWKQRQASRESLIRLRLVARDALTASLVERLARLSGLSLVPAARDVDPSSLLRGPRRPAPAGVVTAALSGLARSSRADAALVVGIDRFITRTGAEREIWLRVLAYLAPTAGESREPFAATGMVRVPRLTLPHHRPDTDVRLAEAAAQQATRQIVHTLATGEEPPFARHRRVAVVPASVPEFGTRDEPSGQPDLMPLGPVQRLRDVLFQPEVGPITDRVDPDEAERARLALPPNERSFWTAEGRPDTDALAALATRLHADYLFVSRVKDAELRESATEPDPGGAGSPRPTASPGVAPALERRAEVDAEGALYRASDGRVLWEDSVQGTTVARTEVVRNRPRIRTEAQCLVDAAHMAYALLRFSFNNYLKRYEK